MALLGYVNQAFEFEFTCSRRVNGVLTLYDPTVVKCSFLHIDGTEDTLVYSGSDPGDANLVRLSTGTYLVTYKPSIVEPLRIRAYSEDVVGTETWPGKSIEFVVRVEPDPHQYTDIPAPTP
jgi:hypothetical protein